MVDHRGDPAGAGQLEQVAEQAESGHVGGAADPSGPRLGGGGGVERRHHLDRRLVDLARCLVPGVEHADADRLGQTQRQPGPPGVDPQQRGRVRGTGHRHAVLRLRVVDAVAAGDVTARCAPGLQAAEQHLRRQLGRQLVTWPAEQVHRHQRLPAHRVDIRQRVGRGDPAERVRVVHHRSEKIGRHHHRQRRAHPHHRAVVTVLDPYQQIRLRPTGHQRSDRLLQLTRRDLARTAATVCILRQPEAIRTSHAPQSSVRPRHPRRPPRRHVRHRLRCLPNSAGAARRGRGTSLQRPKPAYGS